MNLNHQNQDSHHFNQIISGKNPTAAENLKALSQSSLRNYSAVLWSIGLIKNQYNDSADTQE